MKKLFRYASLAFAIVSLSAEAALADRVGPQLNISEHVGGIELSTPDVAALRNGGFVATWYGKGGSPKRSSYLRIFNSEGIAQGPQLAVDQGPDKASAVRVIGLSDGSFMVLWAGARRAHHFDESGQPLGSIFKTKVPRHISGTDVSALQFGGFVIAYYLDGEIIVQKYSNSGRKKTKQKFVIEKDSEYRFGYPRIHSAPGGGLLISALAQSVPEEVSILFWRINRNLGAVASKIPVAEGIPKDDLRYGAELAVNSLDDGGSFVTWEEYGVSRNLHAQFLDRDNQFVGDQLAFGKGRSQDSASVGLEGGGAIVTWTYGKHYDTDIGARHFGNDGRSPGKNFQVDNGDRAKQYTPAIAALPDSRAIVIWLSKPAHEVFGQIVD